MAAPLSLTQPDLALATLLVLLSEPVLPVPRPIEAAVGCRLAEDLVIPVPVPAAATAIRDGWAVAAADTSGASPYGPVPLTAPCWVEAGAVLPTGTDAVLPAFDVSGDGCPAALRDAVSGEGVRAAGEDAPAGGPWRREGERLRALDLPLLAASGAAAVLVRRPRVLLLPVGDEIVRDPRRETLGRFVSCLVESEGAEAHILPPVADAPSAIAAALSGCVRTANLVLTLGGTGEGREDRTVAGLAAAGILMTHGLGARPGGTAGYGTVEGYPVVMLPGRVEDAYAAWLLLVRPALRQLCAAVADPPRRVRLGRKIASTVGLAEVVLLRRTGEPDVAEPLATGSLPLAALAGADAVLVVPHGSEGYERGSWVEVLDV